MDLVEDIVQIYQNYGFSTEVIVASVRSALHVKTTAMIGADIATIPYKVLNKLASHHMTDKGIDAFMKDWEKKA
jgi:transaldolase